MGLTKDELTKEELDWLTVLYNLKNKTVRELVEDLELGGNDTRSAFAELHLLYTDDEE
jgi:hypothetical protein